MIRIALERFLLHIIRRYHTPSAISKNNSTKFLKTTKQRGDQDIFTRVTTYLGNHLSEKTYNRKNMQGQSDRAFPTAENLSGTKRTCYYRVFFKNENRNCQRHDANRTFELYPDFRKARIFFYSLFFQAVQKDYRDDAI